MRKITIVNNLTLDGVMQAPGRPDEDVRDGFEHGGWALPYSDSVIAGEMAKGMGRTELLLGRRTYEDFQPVARLKEQPGQDIVVLGSGELIQSLMRHNLVDEFVLLIHPLVLGSGRQLFRGGAPVTPLRLVNSVMTTTGVIIATYQQASAASR